MINPGSQPVEGAREELAAANLGPFLAAVGEQGGAVISEPIRDMSADVDGRFAWRFEVDGMPVLLLMPGVELVRLREDLTAQAPCLL
uniref:hypothetical protein n=1 Tax=Paractinoplanes polyasparticus TaxID=2856853 RepID=UPI001C84E37B|nr:hypothetical protein [Actinoplanes polyasparticus]